MNNKRKELLQILELVKKNGLSLKQAAPRAGLSYRQLRRLYHRFLQAGEAGLVHGLYGRPSNRSIAEPIHRHIIDYYQKHFSDLGPSRAAEHFAAMGYDLSRETMRRWLIAEGLWQNGKRMPRVRTAKEHFGEMLLLVCRNFSLFRNKPTYRMLFAVDEGTRICMCRVVEHSAESAAMQVLAGWVITYGIPMSIACDRHYLSFQTHGDQKGTCPDLLRARKALGRALEKLGIETLPMSCSLITERVGCVLEKFVSGVKEKIRAGGMISVDQVNILLREPEAAGLDYTRITLPADAPDYHVRLQPGDEPDKIFSYEFETEVSAQGIVKYNNRRFRIIGEETGKGARKGPAGDTDVGPVRRAGSAQVKPKQGNRLTLRPPGYEATQEAPKRSNGLTLGPPGSTKRTVLLTEDLNGRVRVYHGKRELEIREID